MFNALGIHSTLLSQISQMSLVGGTFSHQTLPNRNGPPGERKFICVKNSRIWEAKLLFKLKKLRQVGQFILTHSSPESIAPSFILLLASS